MLQKIVKLDRIIRLKSTGAAFQLARRVEISERTLHRRLNTMKDMGTPIYFNKSRCSYCYEMEVDFIIGFMMKE